MTRGEVNVVDVGMPFDGHAQETGVEAHTVFEPADDECDVAHSSVGFWSLVCHGSLFSDAFRDGKVSDFNDFVVVGNFHPTAFQHDRCGTVFFGGKRCGARYFCLV